MRFCGTRLFAGCASFALLAGVLHAADLTRPAQVTFVVCDVDGRPIAEATIRVRSDREWGEPESRREPVEERDGRGADAFPQVR